MSQAWLCRGWTMDEVENIHLLMFKQKNPETIKQNHKTLVEVRSLWAEELTQL